MPLVPLETYLFPDDVLDAPPALDPSGPRWWVLHTRPRAEKSLARSLVAKALPFFLPLYYRKWRSRGRALESYLPLFPGYLFLYGDEYARLGALETNQVATVLPVPDQGPLRGELANVHHLMLSGLPLTPEERVAPGTAVRIIRGPLTGLEGTVLRLGSQCRLLVEVRFLRQGVSVELESWMIEPIRDGDPALAGGVQRH